MSGDETEPEWLARLALAFYAASVGQGSFHEALDLCARELGADTAFYYVGRIETGERLDLHVGGSVTISRVEEYNAVWAAKNPRQRVWVELPDGHAVDFDSIVPAEAFVETEAWQRFLRLHVPMLHAIGLAVTLAPGLQARFGLGRTEASGRFSASARERFALLGPHLRRAARARLKLIDAATDEILVAEAIGRLDLPIARYGSGGRFLGANAALARLLRDRDGLALGEAGLEPLRPGDRGVLADALRSRNGRARLAIARQRSLVPYLIDLAATGRDEVLVTVTDPAGAPGVGQADLRALFGLSEGQARLASDIAGGLSLREHARAAGIPLETARSRLKAVLARTGCRRQAELAALLARLPALSATP